MFLNKYIYHPSVLLFTITFNATKDNNQEVVIGYNNAFLTFSELKKNEISNNSDAFIQLIMHPNDAIIFKKVMQYLLKNPNCYYKSVHRLKAKNKSKYTSMYFHSIIQQEKNCSNTYKIINMCLPLSQESVILDNEKILGNDLLCTLSYREQNVAVLIAEGKTNKEISSILSISEETVKTHHRNIKRKLQVKNSTHLLQILLKP